ncbi:hypothetical protein [Bartonella sp. TT110JLCBS]|uniref:hypothetical protein n=1 Tax=Bartonella sp. TT110JLCBS TaxID=3243578 RepID=UPI0035D0BAAE
MLEEKSRGGRKAERVMEGAGCREAGGVGKQDMNMQTCWEMGGSLERMQGVYAGEENENVGVRARCLEIWGLLGTFVLSAGEEECRAFCFCLGGSLGGNLGGRSFAGAFVRLWEGNVGYVGGKGGMKSPMYGQLRALVGGVAGWFIGGG